VDPIFILLLIAVCGLILTAILWSTGVVRGPTMSDSRLQAFSKQPGETPDQHFKRAIGLAFAAITAALGTAAFGCAVIDCIPGTNTGVMSALTRISIGAAGLLFAFIGVLCGGRRSSANWPRR
jgi:hypothetical protein